MIELKLISSVRLNKNLVLLLLVLLLHAKNGLMIHLSFINLP